MARPNGVRGGMATVAARLRAARERSFVGRERELELFRSALRERPPPFAVLHVHGPGGVGKTTLLERFADEADAAGRRRVVLDARALGGSPAAFLDALAEAAGAPDAASALEALGAEGAPVLIVDTCERLAALDDWLRDTFLPDLPEGALVVLAGRDPPQPGWRTDPGWRALLRTVALDNLEADESRRLLAIRGVPGDTHDSVLAFTGGHPLALTLVAEVAAQDGAAPELRPEGEPDVIAALVERFARDVPGERHRRALEVCAHARVTTEALLRAVLVDAPARELFDWLCGLSFVERAHDGVFPHDLAREALDADLRWRDPDRYLALHRAIRRTAERRRDSVSGRERDRLFLDLLHLHRRNPVMRRFFDMRSTTELWPDALAPSDRGPVLGLATEHEGPESAAIAAHWLDRRPDGFTIFRQGSQPEPVGFFLQLLMDEAESADLSADPGFRTVWEYVRRVAPLRRGELLDLSRMWVAREYQTAYTHDLIGVRANERWLGTPGLAFSVVAMIADPGHWQAFFDHIDFARATEADFEVGGRRYGAFAHDWRATPPAEWQRLMGSRQLEQDEGPAPRARISRPGGLLVLSETEFAQAVRQALRDYSRPAELDRSPLLRTRLVAAAEPDDGSPADRLRRLIEAAAWTLDENPREEKLLRALDATYLRPAATQEAAAERLGLPFSTYRRHLSGGVERVTAWLWDRELRGGGE